MWQMIGVLAELEWSRTTEPMRAGIKAEQSRGQVWAETQAHTPPGEKPIASVNDASDAVLQALKLLSVDRATVYRALEQPAA